MLYSKRIKVSCEIINAFMPSAYGFYQKRTNTILFYIVFNGVLHQMLDL